MNISELDVRIQIVYYISDYKRPMNPTELSKLIGTTRQSVYNNIKVLVEQDVLYKANGAYTLHPLFMENFDEIIDIFMELVFTVSEHINIDEISDSTSSLKHNIIYLLQMLEILERF